MRTRETQTKYQQEYRRKMRGIFGILRKGQHLHPEKTPEERKKQKDERKRYEQSWNKKHPYMSHTTSDKLLWSARRRAKLKNLEFSISREDIVVPEVCPYLGIPLVRTQPRGTSRRDIASLDRKDNTKGYTKDNIEVISLLANTMKNSASPELLVSFAREVLKRYA